MSSGYWAGGGAADYALRSGLRNKRTLARAGTTALRAGSKPAPYPGAIAKAVQNEVFPYDINYFREANRLEGSLARLDKIWRDISDADASDRGEVFRARESAAMVATARWMYRSALARTETRGMHRREDFPQQDERQRHYITTGGLDEVWTSSRPKAAVALAEAAE
jgi:succinate dehydrogenase/fumarate reductase flavoprotein subunit